MNKLPDRKIVDAALNCICSNGNFKRSQTNELILRYLVDQAFLGKDIKEQTIALELFKKDHSDLHNDSKVRTSVYYLRKKLDEYYNNSGKEEEIRFEIKKGQYNLSFISKNDIKKDSNSNAVNFVVTKKQLFVTTFLVISILCALLINSIPKHNYCWSSFFNAKSSNICVISDHYIARDVNHVLGNTYLLNGNIKNEDDLIATNQKHEDLNLELSHFTLFSKMAPFTIQILSNWFNDNKNNFSIRLESELRFEDHKENNMIFIGQAKNMILTNSVFLQKSKIFKFIHEGYKASNQGNDTTYLAQQAGSKFRDYAMVSYAKTENNKVALFFVSEHDIGVMATVNNFTDRNWMKEFFSSLPKGTNYFNALFEVEGVNRSDVNCNLIELEIIE